jgi:hypothetical protein
MSIPDYYAVLGVPRYYATQAEIRSAYITQAKFFHPDAFNVAQNIALIKMQELNEAYDTLSDVNKKRKYDELLEAQLKRNVSDDNVLNRSPSNQYSYSNTKAHSESQSRTQENGSHKSYHQQAAHSQRPPKGKGTTFVVIVSLLVLVCLAVYSISEFASSLPPVIFKGDSVSASLSTPKPTTKRKPIAMPENGSVIHQFDYGEVTAPLTIVTDGDKNYYVKLRDSVTGTEALSFFVRAGMSAEVEVPLGTYELSYAYGTYWYGVKYLFGDDTLCAKADDVFEFTQDDDYVYGWTVELYLQTDGNLDFDFIDADEF